MNRPPWVFTVVCLLVCHFCVTGCAEGTGDGGAGAGQDAVECHPNLPPASEKCLEGQCGNELGVGQSCSKGGGECGEFVDVEGGIGAAFCTADNSDTDLHYCTRPCTVDGECGADAVCEYETEGDPSSRAGCIPVGCARE